MRRLSECDNQPDLAHLTLPGGLTPSEHRPGAFPLGSLRVRLYIRESLRVIRFVALLRRRASRWHAQSYDPQWPERICSNEYRSMAAPRDM